jgi:hypothetical protein
LCGLLISTRFSYDCSTNLIKQSAKPLNYDPRHKS